MVCFKQISSSFIFFFIKKSNIAIFYLLFYKHYKRLYKLKKLDHLSEIHQNYNTFVIDLWGVMHNGLSLIPSAIKVVNELEKRNKKIVFLSNAPRPSANVSNFLRSIKMDEKLLSNVLTSGQAALNSIKNKKYGKKFYHLGPPRDKCLFEGMESNLSSLKECDYILCTGLFDDKKEDLNFYSDLLRNFKNKKFVCTNPDLIVDKGNVREHCAGAIAKIFEILGGNVVYYGKPHKKIYEMCISKNERTLIIGDNLRTDIKGANNLKCDSVLITNGVHKEEIAHINSLELLLKKYEVTGKYYQHEFSW